MRRCPTLSMKEFLLDVRCAVVGWWDGAGAGARHEVTLEDAGQTRGLGWHSSVAAGRERT